jgi:YHS domain-containing protein
MEASFGEKIFCRKDNAMSRDLVCGTLIDEKISSFLRFEGRVYYFCSEICRRDFKAMPEKYTFKMVS